MTDLDRLAEMVDEYGRGERHLTGEVRAVARELIAVARAARSTVDVGAQNPETDRALGRVEDALYALDTKLAEVLGE